MSTNYLKPGLRGYQPYVPGEQPADLAGWIKLNTNESPLPPSPRVLEAISAAAADSLRLYPSPTAQAAREAVAKAIGMEADRVTCGNGSDELIAMCFRAFAGPGDDVSFCEPTYPLFEPLCAIHENHPSVHPLGEGWALPPEFRRDPAPLKFLVNPNSPIGNWYDAAAVEEVVSASRGVVVIDEAYVDFAPEARLDMVRRYPNALVLRTLSKSSALAGLRFGYAVGHPDLIAGLDLVKDSYNVSRLQIAAAVAAIEDEGHRRRIVQEVVRERDWLSAQLSGIGFQVEPSFTNFVFCRPPAQHPAADVFAALKERKILVRLYQRAPIGGWLRITVGTHGEMESLLEALGEVLA